MPYFLAVWENALMFASVISILETPVPCRMSCFSVCLPCLGVSLCLRYIFKNCRMAACRAVPLILAVLIDNAIVFCVTCSCKISLLSQIYRIAVKVDAPADTGESSRAFP